MRNRAANRLMIAGLTTAGGAAIIRHRDTAHEGELAIPEGMLSIREDAFHGCFGLTDVTIPEGVESIGFLCFLNMGVSGACFQRWESSDLDCPGAPTKKPL